MHSAVAAGSLLILSGGGSLQAAVNPDPAAGAACSVATSRSGSLGAARDLYAANCPDLPRRDCDPRTGGGWACSSAMIGSHAPPAHVIVDQHNAVASPVDAPTPVEAALIPSSCFVRSVRSLSEARQLFAENCNQAVLVDCDPTAVGWMCSSSVIGLRAPGRMVSIAPPVSAPVDVPPGPELDAPTMPSPTTSDPHLLAGVGEADLFALHFDSCANSGESQAIIRAANALDTLDHRTLLAVTGACPTGSIEADAARTAALVFGAGALDASEDREASVSDSADAWAAVIAAGGRVHVAQSGTSYFTDDVLALMSTRYPTIEADERDAVLSLPVPR